LLGEIQGPLPPASERETRMDDPNVSGMKTTPGKCLSGAPGPKLSPIFLTCSIARPAQGATLVNSNAASINLMPAL